MTLGKKTAFVTGGAQGLGQAYVQRFLEEGANVVFGDINEEVGKTAEHELREKHGQSRVMFVLCDVTNGEQFKAAFDRAVDNFGNIDIFVNNAGILNEGVWEKMIDINVTSTVRGTQMAMGHMRKDKGGKGGRIINVSSIIGLSTHPCMPVYCGTKHAVRSFTTSLAATPGLEAAMGIEIAILCPDAANTALMNDLDNDRIEGYDKVKDLIQERVIPVQVVVDGLFSLLKKEESINGAILLVMKDRASFQKVQHMDLGTEWPIPPAEKSEST